MQRSRTCLDLVPESMLKNTTLATVRNFQGKATRTQDSLASPSSYSFMSHQLRVCRLCLRENAVLKAAGTDPRGIVTVVASVGRCKCGLSWHVLHVGAAKCISDNSHVRTKVSIIDQE